LIPPGAPDPIGAIDLGPGVRAAFTTRAAGSATTPDTLARLRRWARTPLALASQVHGRHAVWATPPEDCGAADVAVGEADAICLATPGLTAVIRVADCTPVLVYDAVAHLAAAIHVGRRGLLGGIVHAVVTELQAHGGEPGRMRAAIGPGICARCYEVPAAMADEAAALVPEARSRTAQGTPSIDIPAAVRALLTRAGVRDVSTDPRCTFTDPQLFSYRREGDGAGRMAAMIQLDPPEGR
jgi:YfiH family protein